MKEDEQHQNEQQQQLLLQVLFVVIAEVVACKTSYDSVQQPERRTIVLLVVGCCLTHVRLCHTADCGLNPVQTTAENKSTTTATIDSCCHCQSHSGQADSS